MVQAWAYRTPAGCGSCWWTVAQAQEYEWRHKRLGRRWRWGGWRLCCCVVHLYWRCDGVGAWLTLRHERNGLTYVRCLGPKVWFSAVGYCGRVATCQRFDAEAVCKRAV